MEDVTAEINFGWSYERSIPLATSSPHIATVCDHYASRMAKSSVLLSLCEGYATTVNVYENAVDEAATALSTDVLSDLRIGWTMPLPP